MNHLTTRLHLQVFVTPTCPYCPRAALLAHQMALVSDWVTADAVDATEFPELADRYRVRAVLLAIVYDTVHIEGAVPEAMLMDGRTDPDPGIAGTASGVRQRPV